MCVNMCGTRVDMLLMCGTCVSRCGVCVNSMCGTRVKGCVTCVNGCGTSENIMCVDRQVRYITQQAREEQDKHNSTIWDDSDCGPRTGCTECSGTEPILWAGQRFALHAPAVLWVVRMPARTPS